MEVKKRNIAILGSTGSIGRQALDVIASYPERFEAYALVANNSVELLIEQARRFLPEVVVIANESKYSQLREALSDLPIKVWCGSGAIEEIVRDEAIDMVLTAMVGFSGLKPTISAIAAGKTIALANKETLVVAGELITSLALEKRTAVLPVDSEHSAIFQCLNGEGANPIEKILLTASGGPFRNFSSEQLRRVTRAQALAHPNWNMGEKVTIDSSTLMNKGFEMIEAKWLLVLSPRRLRCWCIHSRSSTPWCSSRTARSLPNCQPDMRMPIQYAFSYPERLRSDIPPVDFFTVAAHLRASRPGEVSQSHLRLRSD